MSNRNNEAIQWFENEIAKLKAIVEQSLHGYSQDEAYQLRAYEAALSALRQDERLYAVSESTRDTESAEIRKNLDLEAEREE